MARCVNCDRSDNGLSYYRPDGLVYGTHFHTGTDGKIYCSECDEVYNEVMSDYYDLDLEDEELDTAYEWDEEEL